MIIEEGKLKMRRNLFKTKNRSKSTEIETRGGATSVVFLDLTWTESDFWDQARIKLIDLIESAPGPIFIATSSRLPALFDNPRDFKLKILPLLNQKIRSAGNFFDLNRLLNSNPILARSSRVSRAPPRHNPPLFSLSSW